MRRQFIVVLPIRAVIEGAKLPLQFGRKIDRKIHIAEWGAVLRGALSEQSIGIGAKDQPTKILKTFDVVVDASDTTAETERMFSMRPRYSVLVHPGILCEFHRLPVSAERDAYKKIDRRQGVKRRHGGSEVGVLERLLLSRVDPCAMETKFGLVEKIWTEDMVVDDRKVAEVVRRVLRKAGHSRTS